MEPIHAFLDRQPATGNPLLPEEFQRLYAGDLRFPPPPKTRPYVVGNFVTTLDGVASFKIAGKAGGREISGADEGDRFIMGLLRASADAIVVGAGTVNEVSPKHVWLPEFVFPEAANLFAHYRTAMLKKPEHPLIVIVSGSGRVDLNRAVFRTPGVRPLVLTTPEGGGRLVDALASAEIRTVDGVGTAIAPAAILELLRAEFHVGFLLHEGGPTLFGRFLADGLVDELCLTVAPQIAGRRAVRLRPSIVAEVDFLSESTPWLEIVSVKQRGNHLYLRYRMRREAEPSGGSSSKMGRSEEAL